MFINVSTDLPLGDSRKVGVHSLAGVMMTVAVHLYITDADADSSRKGGV